MRIIAVTQARLGSTRLPGKILKEVDGTTLLGLHIHRVLKSKKIDELMVATTISPDDDAIERFANEKKLASYRGSVNDVLDRFYQAIKNKNADYVVRLTSDCPLIDASLIDKIVAYAVDNKLEYCSNTLDPHYPDGQDVEVFTFAALEQAWREAKLISEREHVTPFIWKNSSFKDGTLFKSDNFAEGYNFGHLRMTVDEMKDYELVKTLIRALGKEASWLDYANYLQEHEAVREINNTITRNEGYSKSLEKE
jgi:spore coat polysaccharide biosynthesis protein SpsF (cytidylyltransferase family)